jgi:parvulin-like peptidyl-prolyl isomerase
LAKKQVEKPRREPTKRQLSRWQQQKRRQRFIFTIGISIVVVVLGFIGAGFYYQWYVPEYKVRHETVIEVNDTQFDMDYYIKMLEYYGQGVEPTQLTAFADYVVQIIEQSELMRQEAIELGISVSDEEVDEALKSYDPPLSKDYRDVVRTQLLMARLLDEYFDKQVPNYAEQRHIFAMFLESESQAEEVRARLEAGEDFTQLAGELSLDTTSKEKEGDLGWHPEGVLTLTLETSLVDEYASTTEAAALSPPIFEESKTKPVGYWLIKVLERDEEAETAKTEVILLGSEQEAGEVRARLEAGEDFATLAQEFSQHGTSNELGGDFDVSPGTMSEAFDDFVFNSELDVLSQTIRDDTVYTKGGYWLVKVSEIEDNRQVADEDRDLLLNDAFNKWVEGLFADPENMITNYIDDSKRLFAISHVLRD